MEVPELDKLHGSQVSKNFLKKRFPEFVNYIDNKYPHDLKWTEKLYWWRCGLCKRPICPVCGSFLNFINFNKGYQTYCSKKCSNSSLYKKEKFKQTCLEKYGVECPLHAKNIKEKTRQTMLKKYGVEHALQNPNFKEKAIKTWINKYGVSNPRLMKDYYEKYKQTCLEKYGTEYSAQNGVIKEKTMRTCLKKFGTKCPAMTPEFKEYVKTHSKEIKQKEYLTKKKNHTFNTSKIEQQFKQWLIDNNIKFDYQHKDDRYPFNCDFYFPTHNLYLEIQGNWTHGPHPYDPNNPEDTKLLNEWKKKNHKYHQLAVKIWTKSDPFKRETAKKSGLNWVEVFTCDVGVLIEKVKPLII